MIMAVSRYTCFKAVVLQVEQDEAQQAKATQLEAGRELQAALAGVT